MIITTISTSAGAASSEDSIINLNTGGSLPADVNLYASAVDSNDGSANFSFSWHILRKPSTSSVALSDSRIQNPVLEGVDIWGDYRLFCIATNISSNESSEADPIKAPNESFCQVRVRSTHKALVKPAAGERDWFSYAYEWVDAIESYDPLIDGHETRITTLEGQIGVNTFSNLTDTDFSTLVTGQTAIYNASSGKWENGTISTGASNLLLADSDDDFTLSMATGRLTISGTANEIEVVGVSSAGGVVMSLGLPSQVVIGDTLQVGGVLTAQDELTVTNSLNALGDVYVTGSIKDAVSPNAYLIGKVDGWYESDDGQASSECKLMTRCTTPGTTNTTRGGVKLSTDKWSGYNTTGKIPSVHILNYSMAVEHSMYTNSAGDPNVDHIDDTINANQSGATQITIQEHILFHNSSGGEIQIEDISIVVMTGGDIQGQPYIFELTYYDDAADLKSLTQTSTGVTLTATQNSAWLPAVAEATNVGQGIPAGAYFGIKVNQESKIPGARLIANITAIRLL